MRQAGSNRYARFPGEGATFRRVTCERTSGSAPPRELTNWKSAGRADRGKLSAIFRQINVDCPHAHHDALEFPDGDMVLLTYLMEGQEAVVLQLPATGSKAPQRAAYV